MIKELQKFSISLVGLHSDAGDPAASVKVILSDTDLIFGLMMAIFSAAIWASIDPILEPELRKKVFLRAHTCMVVGDKVNT